MAMHADSPLARLAPLLPDDDAEGGSAKAAHAAVGGEGAELKHEDLSANVFNRQRYARGDAAAALAASDVTVEGSFDTNWVYQAYLEPHAATAWMEPDGTLAVATATQGDLLRPQAARPDLSAGRSRRCASRGPHSVDRLAPRS